MKTIFCRVGQEFVINKKLLLKCASIIKKKILQKVNVCIFVLEDKGMGRSAGKCNVGRVIENIIVCIALPPLSSKVVAKCLCKHCSRALHFDQDQGVEQNILHINATFFLKK